MDLRVYFNPTVLWDEVIRDRDALMNGNALVDNGIVLHIAHGYWETSADCLMQDSE